MCSSEVRAMSSGRSRWNREWLRLRGNERWLRWSSNRRHWRIKTLKRTSRTLTKSIRRHIKPFKMRFQNGSYLLMIRLLSRSTLRTYSIDTEIWGTILQTTVTHCQCICCLEFRILLTTWTSTSQERRRQLYLRRSSHSPGSNQLQGQQGRSK